MDHKVQKIRQLLQIKSFALTNKGRISITKVSRSITIIPSEFRNIFGAPVARWHYFAYTFKSKRTVSNIIIQGPGNSGPEFWEQTAPASVIVTTSSQKLINEFIVFLSHEGIWVT